MENINMALFLEFKSNSEHLEVIHKHLTTIFKDIGRIRLAAQDIQLMPKQNISITDLVEKSRLEQDKRRKFGYGEDIGDIKTLADSIDNTIKKMDYVTKHPIDKPIVNSMKNIKKETIKTSKSIFAFSRAMGALSILFASQIVMRQLMSMTTSAITFYQSLAMGQTEASRGIIALSANWQYLKFTIGEAIGTMLLGFLPALIEMIQKISDFIQEHPKLAAFAFKFVLIGTAIAWALAQLILLGSGIVNLTGAKSIEEVGEKFAEWRTKIKGTLPPLTAAGIATLVMLAIVLALVAAVASQPEAWKQFKTEVGLINNQLKIGLATLTSSIGSTMDWKDAWLQVTAVASWMLSFLNLGFAWFVWGATTGVAAIIGAFKSLFDFLVMGFAIGGAAANAMFLGIQKIYNATVAKLPGFGEWDTTKTEDALERSVKLHDSAKKDIDDLWANMNINADAGLNNLVELDKLAKVSIKDRLASYKTDATITTETTPIVNVATAESVAADEMTNAIKEVDMQWQSAEETMSLLSTTATERFKDMNLSITETSIGVSDLGTAVSEESTKNILPNLEKINTGESTLLDTVMMQSIAYQDLLTNMMSYLNNGVAAELITLTERIDKNNRLNTTYDTQIRKLERIKELQSNSGGYGSSFTSKTGTNSYGG